MSPARSGRRPGAEDTRGRITAAARGAFAERGFDGATIRSIAEAAEVDPALVHHYFGTKQQLFIAAMEMPVDVAAMVPLVMAGPPDMVGERFLRFVLAQWEAPPVRSLFLGIVRSAATDPVAAGMLRRVLAEGPLLAIVRALGTPDAALRAALAGSQFVGLVMARYVVGIEPLASASAESVARAVGPTIQRYLTGDIGADQGAR